MSRTAHSRRLILGFHLFFTLCYLMIILLCTYISVSIFDYTFTEIAEIQLTSFGDLIHAAILLVSCFFIGLTFMLILSYAPSISKELVSRPFRSEPENRFQPTLRFLPGLSGTAGCRRPVTRPHLGLRT